MFYKKNIKKGVKKAIGVLFIGALGFGLFSNIGYTSEKPVFNDHSEDRETLKLGNETKGTDWSTSPISADPGDVVAFNIYYHNTVEDTTAENTRLSIDYPSTKRTEIDVTGEVSADNADSVFDERRINISKTSELEFESLAYWYPDRWEEGDDWEKIDVNQVSSSKVEVDIGDIDGCWPYQGHVVFYAEVVEKEEKEPWGDLECDTVTENSITLFYDTEDATSASIFRGSTRIRTVGSGNRSGTYKDTGLSPDTSYVYYLRNGRYDSSERLAKAYCSTKPEEVEEELTVRKKVKSLDRDTYYTNSISALPGELLSYSIRVTAEGVDVRDIKVKDTMPSERIKYEGNLRVGGSRVSGNIENGIDIGDIDKGEYKEVTFDAKVASRDEFLIGTTGINNIARATSRDATDTGRATVRVTKDRPTAPPTEVPTGITGSGIVDYFVLPLLLALMIFFLFRKQFKFLAKRIEAMSKEVRADWHVTR